LRLPLGPLRKLVTGQWRAARSCNLAVWRSDLERIDGFDASFSGWGREDSDLIVRLLHAGVRRKDGRFATGVVHLWHPAADRTQLAANEAKLDGVLRSGRAQAECGLSSLREHDAAGQPASQPLGT
jgi:N-terminal domain of galactosyltransferase